MLKVCPGCGRLLTVESTRVVCPYCGAEISVAPEELPEHVRRQMSGRTPWDERHQLGAFRAYLETWRKLMSSPAAFFQSMPVNGDFWGPLLFGLITMVIGGLLALFWQAVFITEGSLLEAILAEMGMSLADLFRLAIFLIPLGAAFQIFLWTGVFHALVWLLARGGRGIAGTFRVVCFSSAPYLLYVIPFCGGLLAAVWSLVLTVIGLRETHRISGAVATFVVLLPFLTCLGLGLAAIATMFESVLPATG